MHFLNAHISVIMIIIIRSDTQLSVKGIRSRSMHFFLSFGEYYEESLFTWRSTEVQEGGDHDFCQNVLNLMRILYLARFTMQGIASRLDHQQSERP